jgi:hypothetical protein
VLGDGHEVAIMPKGSPRKSVSVPATTTRTPRAARVVTTSTMSWSRNWASSMPTSSVSERVWRMISAALSTGIASNSMPLWLETRNTPP